MAEMGGLKIEDMLFTPFQRSGPWRPPKACLVPDKSVLCYKNIKIYKNELFYWRNYIIITQLPQCQDYTGFSRFIRRKRMVRKSDTVFLDFHRSKMYTVAQEFTRDPVQHCHLREREGLS